MKNDSNFINSTLKNSIKTSERYSHQNSNFYSAEKIKVKRSKGLNIDLKFK